MFLYFILVQDMRAVEPAAPAIPIMIDNSCISSDMFTFKQIRAHSLGADVTQRLASTIPSQILNILQSSFSVNRPFLLFLQNCLSQLDEGCLNVDIGLCRSLHEIQSMLFCHLYCQNSNMTMRVKFKKNHLLTQ